MGFNFENLDVYNIWQEVHFLSALRYYKYQLNNVI